LDLVNLAMGPNYVMGILDEVHNDVKRKMEFREYVCNSIYSSGQDSGGQREVVRGTTSL